MITADKLRSFIRNLLLLQGAISTRVSLLSSYIIFTVYVFILGTFFSLPPGPASATSARMDRVLSFGMSFIEAMVIAAILWISSIIIFFVSLARSKKFDITAFSFLALPVVTLMACGSIYGAFSRGYGASIHKFLYELPKYF